MLPVYVDKCASNPGVTLTMHMDMLVQHTCVQRRSKAALGVAWIFPNQCQCHRWQEAQPCPASREHTVYGIKQLYQTQEPM